MSFSSLYSSLRGWISFTFTVTIPGLFKMARLTLSDFFRLLCINTRAWIKRKFGKGKSAPTVKLESKPILFPRGYGKPVHIERANGTYADYISISEASRGENMERVTIQHALRFGKDKAGNIWKHAHPMSWTRGMKKRAE